MNVAKNGRSKLQNMLEILIDMSAEDFEKLREYSTGKREQPKYLTFFNEFREAIEGETLEPFDEAVFKKDYRIKHKISDINKLIEHTYDKLLQFLASAFMKKEQIVWQEELRNALVQVEALTERKHYSIAAAELVKLEERLTKEKLKIENIWDDWSLFSRMAQLKIHLKVNLQQEFIEKDEFDELLSQLLSVGNNIYRYKTKPPAYLLTQHKLVGYRLLGKYMDELGQHNRQLKYIQALATTVKKVETDSEAKQAILAYLKLEEAHLLFKLGDSVELKRLIEDYSFNGNPRGYAMQLQQPLFDLLLANRIDTGGNPDSERCLELLKSLYGYSDNAISNSVLRIELNTAILQFIRGHYQPCLDLIVELKKKKPVIQDKLLYTDLLFIEVMARMLSKRDTEADLFRSLKMVGTSEAFDKKAVELLRKYAAEQHFFDPFRNRHKQAIEELENLQKEGQPVQKLIITFLNGGFPKSKK